ncbi:hypothetical protein LEL_03225 [Akanthomyces lecanii RCEF 1005]|uniref:Uncharacterized protein n=1 Tax=Akanthomyces lecanii RCEF 1005 TaxID=1081108 RepID=A0A168IWJ1_CORDF|nr:hypothetical protein LEL_03225 [Akanthomyces lecanii RCEF 1005]
MAAANTSSVSLTPTSSAFRPVLLYDKNAPPTIVAFVATARPPADGSYSPGDYIEFHVACASPCPVHFPPQTVTQKSGSIWGGNHVVAGTTTAWDCILGTNIYNVNDFGNCYTTTLSFGEPWPTSGSYTQVGTCQIFARSKMMFVTAGFDEYFKVMPPETRKPDNYESYVTSELSSAGCPSSVNGYANGQLNT